MEEKSLLEDVNEDAINLPYKRGTAFPKASRVLKKRMFGALREKGLRFHGETVLIQYLPSHQNTTKLGITASAKSGPAHLRNRFKRLLREVFRTNADRLPRTLLLDIRPKGKLENPSFTTLKKDFDSLIKKLTQTDHPA